MFIQKGQAEKINFDGSDYQIVRIHFKCPYPHKPTVHVGIVAIDDWEGSQVRLRIGVKNVHTHYVDIEIISWQVSRLFQAKFEWIAFGESDANVSGKIVIDDLEKEHSAPVKREAALL